jgi:glycosyltransferase involved in cell wall biosynthesis
MKRVFVNGINAKSGGGRSILTNYLRLLSGSSLGDCHYYVLTPDRTEYLKFENKFIHILHIHSFFKLNICWLLLNYYVLPRIIRKLEVDVVFNLSDIVITTPVRQVYLFDWAYAVYPESLVWKRMSWRAFAKRRIKLELFKVSIRNASLVVAQTQAMSDRLKQQYGLSEIKVVHNAVSLENLNGTVDVLALKFNIPPSVTKFLYLSCYYPHKNFEIFLELAKKIKANRLNYVIVITIDKNEDPRCAKFLRSVEQLKLNDVIINVGSIPMEAVPAIYGACDALLMPTLLESFSGTYVEAMFHSVPILTSDFDFARCVCGDAALYFDPCNVESIMQCMRRVTEDQTIRNACVTAGGSRLRELSSWEVAFNNFQLAIHEDNK